MNENVSILPTSAKWSSKNAGKLPDVTDYSLLLMFFKHICNVDDIQRMQPPDFVNHIAVLEL